MIRLNTNPGLLRTAVYERILSDLQQGIIVPGEAISLNKLAEALNISKTPLRDALLELQAEGFVTLYPQRGVMVNVLSEEEKREIYEVCGVLDGQVIRNVFPRMTPGHIARLKELNARMHPGTQDISSDEYNRINLAFHETYLELETSALLRKLLRINRLRLFQFSQRDWGKAFCAADHAEHGRIIELFESGTAEELSRYVTQVHWSFNRQQGTES